MLIESLIKRPHAPINLGGRDYFFKPLDGDPTSPHVCEVDDAAHIERLLSITEGYRAAVAPKALTREATKPASAPQTPPPVSIELTAEQAERVTALRGSTVADLRAIVPGITDAPVLQAALDAETQAQSPRKTIVELLTARVATLASAPAADPATGA